MAHRTPGSRPRRRRRGRRARSSSSGIWTMTWIRQRSAMAAGSISRTAAASGLSERGRGAAGRSGGRHRRGRRHQRRPGRRGRRLALLGRHRLGQRHVLRRAGLHPVADVGDRQLVAGPELAHLDPLAVDPDAVGAAEVADDHLAAVLVLHHAAMTARDTDRVEPGIALGVPADDQHRPIEHDIGPLIQGYQECGHRCSALGHPGGATGTILPRRDGRLRRARLR